MSNPGQVALGVVGAGVGFVVGGPTGAAYGLQIGLAVGSVVSPTQLPGTFGPKLNDNRTTTAELGAAIPYVWGSDVVAGTVIWLGDIVEHSETEEVGGKGGPEGESTTFTYTQSIALGLCQGPRGGLRRIWENGKLVYDTRLQLDGEDDDTYAARAAAAADYALKFALYLGDEAQMPDPTIEAKEGAGNVPAYRGLMYIVFTDRELTQEQGQRHPNFKFEVAAPDITSLVALANSVTGAATGKYVMTSEDYGETWTMRSTPVAGWFCLASSQSLRMMIAVATSGAVMKTLDAGRTWTSLGAAISVGSSTPRDVVWSEELGIFVCITNNSIFTSPDGATWTVQTEPAGVTYQNIQWISSIGRFAVMGYNGSTGIPADIYSTDGITWTLAAHPRSRAPFTLASNAGGGATDGSGVLFFGQSSDDMYYSADADTYVTRTLSNNSQPGSAHVSGASAAPGEFVIGWPLTSTNQIIKTIDNGGHFVGATSGVLVRSVSEVVYQNGRYVLLYATGNILGGPNSLLNCVATSPNGLVWTPKATPSAADDAVWSDFAVSYAEQVETATLSSIVADICRACGLASTDYDVSELASVSVVGYQVNRVCDGRSAIAVLRQIGFFDAVESEGKIKFTKRGKAPVRTLDVLNFGAHEDTDNPPPAITTATTQDVELPRQLFVQYKDPARDYEQGQQASPTRLITNAVNDQYVDVAVVIDGTQALRAAEVLWADAWAQRWRHTITVDASQIELEVTDCILVPVDGRLERMRIVSAEESAIVLRQFSLLRDDDGSYVSVAIADPPAAPPPSFTIYAPTLLVLLDLPPLRAADDEPGIYAAAVPTTDGRWGGAAFYRAPVGEPVVALASVTNQAVIGTLASPLPAGDFTTWDFGNEVIVDLPRGQFETRTEADVLAGANTIAVGIDGRWEILQFVTAAQIGPTQWKLTTLLRGRRGTDHNIGLGIAGDTVVLISGLGIIRLPLDITQVGSAYTYRAVTLGTAVANGIDQDFTGHGEALVPFSPVHVHSEDAGGGDLLITWTRRDRLAIDYVPSEPTPLSEDPEAYVIEIMDGASPLGVARTLASSTESVTYTHAQQLDDFGSPAPDDFTVRIYQVGQLGRGHYREAIV